MISAFPQPTPEDLADIVRQFELTERACGRREVCKILKISDDSVDRLTAGGAFAGQAQPSKPPQLAGWIWRHLYGAASDSFPKKPRIQNRRSRRPGPSRAGPA